MDFAAPARLFWLLGVAGWVAAALWRARRDGLRLGRLGAAPLVTALVDGPRPGLAVRSRALRAGLLAGALALLVIAAARPRFGLKLTEVRRKGNDVIIAVDVSRSMLAEDVPPSRLAAAKRSLGLLVRQLSGDRVGIVAFAGEAFLQCPLTLDVDAAGQFLETLNPAVVPVGGTNLGAAVRKSVARFPRQSRARKIVVLLTDGEDTRDSAPLDAAADAAGKGVIVHTIGLGTPQGDVIRERDAGGAVQGFKKDEKGETVVSRLDEATLLEMARRTGGRYVRGGADDGEILALAGDLSSAAQQTLSTQMYKVREERYQWFLLAALLLLFAERLVPRTAGHWGRVRDELRREAAAFDPARLRLPRLKWLRRRGGHPWDWRRRRGAAALLLTVAAAGWPDAARADFRREIRRGNRLARDGRMEEARAAYFAAQSERPDAAEPSYNVGNTYLAEGKHEDALKAYDQAAMLAKHPLLKSVVAYNRGWAELAAGDTAGAIEGFKEALRWNPGDEDAKFNIEAIRSGKMKPRPRSGKGQPKEGGNPKPGQLGKEDAERVLEMVRDQEKRMREEQKKRKTQDPKAGGGRDW